MTLTKRRAMRLFAGVGLIALLALVFAACTVQGRGISDTNHGPVFYDVNLTGYDDMTGYIRFASPKFYFISTGTVDTDYGSDPDSYDADGTGTLNGRPVTFDLTYNDDTGYTTFDATGTDSNSHFHKSFKGNLFPKVTINDD